MVRNAAAEKSEKQPDHSLETGAEVEKYKIQLYRTITIRSGTFLLNASRPVI